ncbi:MAG: hypothetical protein AUJ71_04630 [Candidatus Omnitrophica bacterium CG1_02_49_16]|nr:MAG: hypothetical protein AUJ71_04630 [Candidatus Omnitrophica bacterium CG1_02_49_16]
MEFLTAGIFSSLWSTALLVVVLFAAGRMGRLLLGCLGCKKEDFVWNEALLFSWGIGLIFLSLAVLAIGLTGLLTRTSLVVLIAFLILVTSFFKHLNPFEINKILSSDLTRWGQLFIAAVSFVVILSWIQAVMPPIGNDALAYHLYHAKEFVLHQRIAYVPYSRESLWPYQTEMLFTLGLALQGTLLAGLFHWIFYPLTAALIFSFCLRHHSLRVAQIASLIFLLTPAAFAQSGHAYVDLSLTFFIFLALYAFSLKDSLGGVKAALLSGLCMGGALSTKYLGLSAFVALLALWIWDERKNVKVLICYTVSAGAVSVVWYLRSWWLIGNPFYPFFSRWFGGHGFDFDIGAGVGMGTDLPATVLFLWNLTLRPWNFGGESMGPVYLMFTPLAIALIPRARQRMLGMAGFAVFFFLILFHQSQQARFYLALTPCLSVAAASVIYSFLGKKTWTRPVIAGFLTVILALHLGIFFYRLRSAWPVLFGKESAENYLMIHERSFRGYWFIKNNAKTGERLFNTAEVRYFFNPMLNGMIYDCTPLRLDLQGKHLSMEQFLEKEKFSYIWTFDDTAADVRHYIATHKYKKVYSYDFTEKLAAFHYDIYQLYT